MIYPIIKHRLNYLLHKASKTNPHIHHLSVRESEESTHSYTRTTQQNPASQTKQYFSLPYVKGLS